MFYSHSEINLMTKSHMRDIRESCNNCKYNKKQKKPLDRKASLNLLLITKVFSIFKIK